MLLKGTPTVAKPHFIESLKETLRQFKDEHRTIARAVDEVESMLTGLLTSKDGKRRGRPPGTARRGRPAGKKATSAKPRGLPAGGKAGRKTGKSGAKKAGKKAAPRRKAKSGGRQWTPEQKRAAAERLAAARAAKKSATPRGDD